MAAKKVAEKTGGVGARIAGARNIMLDGAPEAAAQYDLPNLPNPADDEPYPIYRDPGAFIKSLRAWERSKFGRAAGDPTRGDTLREILEILKGGQGSESGGAIVPPRRRDSEVPGFLDPYGPWPDATGGGAGDAAATSRQSGRETGQAALLESLLSEADLKPLNFWQRNFPRFSKQVAKRTQNENTQATLREEAERGIGAIEFLLNTVKPLRIIYQVARSISPS